MNKALLRNKALLSVGAAVLLMIGGAGLAVAAGVSESEGLAPTPMEQGARTSAGAGASAGFVGQPVYNSEGQEIGTIEEIVMQEDGSEQAVLSVGGFLGMGAKQRLVAKDMLQPREDSGFDLNITEDELEELPAYEGGAEAGTEGGAEGSLGIE